MPGDPGKSGYGFAIGGEYTITFSDFMAQIIGGNAALLKGSGDKPVFTVNASTALLFGDGPADKKPWFIKLAAIYQRNPNDPSKFSQVAVDIGRNIKIGQSQLTLGARIVHEMLKLNGSFGAAGDAGLLVSGDGFSGGGSFDAGGTRNSDYAGFKACLKHSNLEFCGNLGFQQFKLPGETRAGVAGGLSAKITW